ncbi:hypothetical protein GCM10008910_07620 [Faecalicatena orotica]|uniref:Regulatory GntR family protein n=1 Tax=Faecalicatena orotica TaxID=1544 RepID=A0A2Y9CAU0_9FIRM|nr:GntR family transcriptional regulator [Faecalicatena orotica]PWJ19431.1 regulatory GntR family protein [Faecalicatena orotica]SSA58643.1 regulatory protein, gntR family [Faecalicatena orotica]
MYNFDRSNKKPLGDQIEDRLMQYILNEPVNVGQRLPNEFELAGMFGVGREPVHM